MNLKERKKWMAFFIVGITFSIIMYIFKTYYVLSTPAPAWVNVLFDHWWITYLIIFLLPVCLIRFFLHEPLYRYGLHCDKPFFQFLFVIFFALLMIFLGNPVRFWEIFAEKILRLMIHAKYNYVHTFLPGLDYFLAILGNIMLFEGFFLRFFQDIFRNKLIPILLVSLLSALFSDITSADAFFLNFFYTALYTSLRTLMPKQCTILSLVISQYLYEFYWSIY
nr:hypothetical protein [uncultured Sellimonas sp.]